jgi:predicted phosphatase
MTKYIFDLDKTIWDCHAFDGSSLFAKQMVPPFVRHGDKILDSKNSICALYPGVREFLESLRKSSQDVGYLSLGGGFNISMDHQPSVLLLKEFGLYGLFNSDKILDYYLDADHQKKTKNSYLAKIAPCVFLDDDDVMIKAAKSVKGVKAVDRKSIQEWTQILD